MRFVAFHVDWLYLLFNSLVSSISYTVQQYIVHTECTTAHVALNIVFPVQFLFHFFLFLSFFFFSPDSIERKIILFTWIVQPPHIHFHGTMHSSKITDCRLSAKLDSFLSLLFSSFFWIVEQTFSFFSNYRKPQMRFAITIWDFPRNMHQPMFELHKWNHWNSFIHLGISDSQVKLVPIITLKLKIQFENR